MGINGCEALHKNAWKCHFKMGSSVDFIFRLCVCAHAGALSHKYVWCTIDIWRSGNVSNDSFHSDDCRHIFKYMIGSSFMHWGKRVVIEQVVRGDQWSSFHSITEAKVWICSIIIPFCFLLFLTHSLCRLLSFAGSLRPSDFHFCRKWNVFYWFLNVCPSWESEHRSQRVIK